MTEQQLYDRAINILDNFHEESEKVIKEISVEQSWKEQTIYKLFRQSSHIIFALLSNSDKSKFQNPTYVTELILIGTLGRIVRDIYVNIIYLKTNTFSDEDMKDCWDFQIICQKLNVLKFEVGADFEAAKSKLTAEKELLESKIKKITCETKGDLLRGKAEKLLSLKELAEIKGFHKEKFHNEFVYFSQYAHSTAFANSFLTDKGVYLGLVAATYDKIVSYFVGIVAESLDVLYSDHPQLQKLQAAYREIIDDRWNVKTPST